MAQHMEDMSLVPDPGEAVPVGWYHVRISKVTEGESEGKKKPIVDLLLKVQNEGPAIGRTINVRCSLQPHALFSLKAFYTACGYKPPAGQGHDPDNLLDCECWVGVEHKIVDGVLRIDIKSFNVRSITDGPGKSLSQETPSVTTAAA